VRAGTTTPFNGIRVIIVSDDDEQAKNDLGEKDLARLDQESALFSTNGDTMYVRDSLWERIKKRFPKRAA
jgi:hypothetical protein